MQSLKNKTVFITGASSGIGKACAQQFAAAGANLVLTARRLDRLQELSEMLEIKYDISTLSIQLDVRNQDEVKTRIKQLPSKFSQIDILLNNAGLALATDKLHEGKIDDWETMIDTNIKGLLYVTRAILPSMVERKIGHVINIGSIAGHEYYPAGNVYSATKHAVKALSKSLLIDLYDTPVRVSSVDPGAVDTEFSVVRWNDAERAKQFYADFTPLSADDIADAVVYCASRPAHVNIAEMVVLPTDQGSANHLNKHQ
jgi:3-hydroxy acid dehydrogenase/malonic semialdehyde reductase